MRCIKTYMFIRKVRSENGIALVTALILMLISLGVIMSLMYVITSSIRLSGTSKRYKNALQASKGGMELITKDLFPLSIFRLGFCTTLLTFQLSNFV